MEHLYWPVAILWTILLVKAQKVEDNSKCVFPFKYKDKLYSTCVIRDHTKLWCSTTDDYDQDRQWRECRDEDLAHLPTFNTSTKTNVTARVGETVRLPCVINNLNYRQTSWQKVGDQYPLTVATRSFLPNGKYIVENSVPEEWNLIIHTVSKSDRGVYQCRVATRALQLVREVRLIVKGKKSTPLMSTTSSLVYFEQDGQTNLYLSKGANLTISCNSTNIGYVDGQQQVIHHNYILWFKDNEMVDSNTKNGIIIVNYVIKEIARSVLTIEGMQTKDAGNYYCISNETTIAKFNVYVKNSDPMSQDQPVDRSQLLPSLNPEDSIPDSRETTGNHSTALQYFCQTQIFSLLITVFIFVKKLNLVAG